MNRKSIKRAVRIMALMLTVANLFTLSGCFLNPKSDAKFPEYEDDREMLIGGWDSPMNTLKDIQIAKEMGLTHIFLDGFHAKRGTKGYEDALKLYEEGGLDVIVQIGGSGRNESTVVDNTDYSKFPAVEYLNYWDEPYWSSIDRVAELTAEHIEKYGDDVKFFGNLFPNSATGAFEGHTYREYVKKWAENVLEQLPEGQRILSVDLYPLEERNGQPVIRANWLGCIETAALQAKESKATTHFFIQATKHYTYRAVDEADIRFQFYVNMAFGVQAFSYFTYADSVLSDFDHSCVSRLESGKIHDTYYMAQNVNNEIKKFDHVYLNYEWQGTIPVLGKNNEEGYNLNFDGLTNSPETLELCNRWDATEDALIGIFKDKDGNDGLIVTNFTDPALKLNNLVRFDFKDVSKARVYRGGVAYDYEVENNRLDIELAPGEGVFIILVH